MHTLRLGPVKVTYLLRICVIHSFVLIIIQVSFIKKSRIRSQEIFIDSKPNINFIRRKRRVCVRVLELDSMVIRVVDFSSWGYKIGKIFA